MSKDNDSDLVGRARVNRDIMCDVRRHGTGFKAHLYPMRPEEYWSTHLDVDLTEREVQMILDMTKNAKEQTHDL